MKRTLTEIQQQYTGVAYREISSWRDFRAGLRETWWGKFTADRQVRRIIARETGISLTPLLPRWDIRGRVEARREVRRLIADARAIPQSQLDIMEETATTAKQLPDATEWIRGRYDAKAMAYASVILGMTNPRQFARLLGMSVGQVRKLNILSVGEGTGELTSRVLREPIWTGSIKALDISAEMLAEGEGRKNYDGLGRETYVGNAEQLPFSDESEGAILLPYVLDTVTKPGVVLKECKRVLKSGGKLVIFTPFPLRVESGSRRFVDEENQIGNAQNPLQDMLALERELVNLGFDVQRRKVGDFVDRDLGGPENWNCFVFVCEKLPERS